ncbi:RNA polymerase subunit sigma-24 [Paenibacillus glycanilyticus]|uniref:RNA polymerase subunit sigma-24 n=1 Tax=Paenibacillus glycanilyticus TaxID=126569 RepID=UPI000FDAF8B0|nr:RNA polymerase subunit sigma-24 [Paenibacillus glycanilyticus]
MNEKDVIDQLSRYREMQARIQVLSTYSVGAGITVSRLNKDDQLQELHRKLRGLPTYMYLSGYEQKLEATAHAYLERYPAGIKSQLHVIRKDSVDPEDRKLLEDLQQKIQKVVEARGYDVRDDLDLVLERVAELQDLLDEVTRIDNVLTALKNFRSEYEMLLRRKYIDGEPWNVVAIEMGLSKATFFRRQDKAVRKYIALAG